MDVHMLPLYHHVPGTSRVLNKPSGRLPHAPHEQAGKLTIDDEAY